MALSISDICVLFARKGGRAYAGEPVNQIEHALQTAMRAEDEGASHALINHRRCAASTTCINTPRCHSCARCSRTTS